MLDLQITDAAGNRQSVAISTSLYSDNTPLLTDKFLDEFALKAEPIDCTVGSYGVGTFDVAMMLGHRLKDVWDIPVNLFIPYFPGARQDRSNPTGDILFAAKYYTDIVNRVGFDQVAVVDPHSDVVPALLNNCVAFSVADVYSIAPEKFGTYDGVIAPDAGAAKRAYVMAQELNVPVYQAWKHRSLSDGSLQGFGCEDIPEGYFLLVDDICDGGGTFIGLAEDALPAHADYDLYVTHGIFSKGTDPLFEVFGEVITTDSLPQYHSNHTVISLRTANA